MLRQQTTVEKEVASSSPKVVRMKASAETVPDRISEWRHKHLQYAERTPRKRPHEPRIAVVVATLNIERTA